MVQARLPELCWIGHGGGMVGHTTEQGLLVHCRGRNDLGGAHLLHLLNRFFLLILVKEGVVMPGHF